MNINFTNALLILLISNGMAFLGYLFHGWLGDRIGRRNTIAMGWIMASVSYGAMLMLPQGNFGPVVALYSVGLFFLIGPFSALMFFTGESFPSTIRATATSIITASGMVGNILAGVIVTTLLSSGEAWTRTAFIAGIVPTLLGGMLIFFAPHRDPQVACLD
ncbi:MFS transporter [Arthrobacter yangruifuii]|uniref:MFS transporter n=1 Tax=Arthrobacter yangruifuii TaxID=2606616 RepID=A0A5N6MQ44_9MICC|nr:MFS transporter [Arthrobacter yangruifuii]KAD3720582.1 MFS transporter [Arthrobacter yangruifuii]